MKFSPLLLTQARPVSPLPNSQLLLSIFVLLVALSSYEMRAANTCKRELLPSLGSSTRQDVNEPAEVAAVPLGAVLSSGMQLLLKGPYSDAWEQNLFPSRCRAQSLTRTFATTALYWILTSPLHLLNLLIVFTLLVTALGILLGGLTALNSMYFDNLLPFFTFKSKGIAPEDEKLISPLGWKLINVPKSFYVPLWILISIHWVLWIPTIVSNLLLCRYRRFTHQFRKGPIIYKKGMKKPSLEKPNMDGKPEWDVEWIDRLLSTVPTMMDEMKTFIQEYERGKFGPSDHYELVNFVPTFGRNLAKHSTWNEELEKRCRGLQETIKATAGLAGQENVVVAKIVRLEPKRGGSGVQSHVDIYPNVLNILLPIHAPMNKSFFYIRGGGIIPFKTGEPIVFNPSFLHAAWNDSEDCTRYVYNVAVSTGRLGSLKRFCAYNFTKKVGSYRIRYYSD